MPPTLSEFKGVIRAGAIELEQPVNLPDGQAVTVVVRPSKPKLDLQPGEGLRRSFGGWAADGEELDKFLEWNRNQRKQTRRGIEE